jgi:hypothetical protein
MVLLKLDERLLVDRIEDMQYSIEFYRETPFVVLELPPGDSVQHTLEKHRILLKQPVVAVVNQQTADFTRVLEDGDHVRLLPQIAGGR